MEAITHEPTSSPTCLPLANSWSWKTSSSPRAKSEFGSRTLLAAIGENGLKTTSKVSVLALWAPGSAAWEAAETATTPTRARTKAAAALVRASLRMVPPPGCRAAPDVQVRLCCPAAPEEVRPRGNPTRACDAGVPARLRVDETLLVGAWIT